VKKGSKGFSVTVWAAIAVGAVGVGVVLAFLAGYFLGHYTGHENTTTVSMVPAGGVTSEALGEEEASPETTESKQEAPPEPEPEPEAPAEEGGKAGGGGAEAALAAGKTVFTTNCGSCHTLSEAGTSGNVGPNLDELKPEKALVEKQVTNGGGGMPPFGGVLSPEEIEDVAEYVSTVAGTGS
jgi:mono/diheme cytochrome c family protein